MREIFSLSQRNIDGESLLQKPLARGDKLFNVSDNLNDPKFAPASHDNEFYYAYGYASSAIFLLQMINFGKSYIHKDSYIYPAIFCFRMYLEIVMKLIIQNLSDQQNIKSDIEGHNLIEKWKIIRDNYMGLVVDDDIIAVENILNGFSAMDPEGTLFRYPKKLNDKIGQNNLKFKPTLIDVAKLRERFLQLYKFFEGLYDSVDPNNK